jgi:hypothetical protein
MSDVDRSLLSSSKPTIRIIGYWHFKFGDGYSHPQALVDPAWESGRRAAIVRYLRAGFVLGREFGSSYCRFGCPEFNGSADLCDDAWLWPDGLAHYVEHHLIRLPDEFVAHAASRDF